MTKPVELENLLDDFATELTDEEMEEVETFFQNTTIVSYLRDARKE